MAKYFGDESFTVKVKMLRPIVPDGSITSEKLANGSVTELKIANGAVSTSKLKDSNVTSAKLGSKSVTVSKLGDDVIELIENSGGGGGGIGNTAGATDSSSKLFIVGAPTQATNPVTYSHDKTYIGSDDHLYSNDKQVVNLSDSQALTNKTYNGYTLGAACAKGVDTSIASGSTSTNVPTSKAVADAIIDILKEKATTGYYGEELLAAVESQTQAFTIPAGVWNISYSVMFTYGDGKASVHLLRGENQESVGIITTKTGNLGPAHNTYFNCVYNVKLTSPTEFRVHQQQWGGTTGAATPTVRVYWGGIAY